MQISPQEIGASCTILALASGFVASRVKEVKALLSREIADLKESTDKRITALKVSSNEEDDELTNRLSAIERDYISRTDHAEFRMEMLKTYDNVNEKLDSILKAVSGMGERVAKLEGAAR